MRDIFYPIMLGLMAAIFLNAIYFLLKSQGSKGALRIFELIDQQVLSYLAVSEFIRQERLPVWGYLAFRGLPVATVLLIANASLNAELMRPGYENWILLFSFLICNMGFTFIGGRRLLPYNSIRITYLVMMGFVAVVGAIVTLIAISFDISLLAINLSEIVSNLVAAFISAALVVLYFQSSNMSSRQMSRTENEFQIRTLVLRHSVVIMHKLGNPVYKLWDKYRLDHNFVVSILTYEDLNRPKSIRKIENLIVRVFKVELTVGIAQVRSRIPLKDDESIEKMGEILSKLLLNQAAPISRWVFLEVLEKYNGSKRYAGEVMKIYDVLQSEVRATGPVG